MQADYIFRSERLGFRDYVETDIPKLAVINADPEVMEFFPSIISLDQTISYVKRMKKQLKEKGFCYFAVDELQSGDFIGFIGLCEQTFESSFTPCIDIGWRLDKKYWHKGFATEGAKRCLEYGFNELGLKQICAIAPVVNIKSLNVMKKIGMEEVCTFDHPLLLDNKRLKSCKLCKKEI
jgi:RimJ/RimL family protein N-acetyltransferase